MTAPMHVTSKDNPLLQRLRRLAQDPAAYRRIGSLWLEGDHLCRAFHERGGRPGQAVLTESAWQQPALRALADVAVRTVIVPDALFHGFSALESAASIGYVIDVPAAAPVVPGLATVVLDRLQDAGNVGSILRSAAALGMAQVLALKGTAALWSPKVLRAGMGAHFALRLVEGLQADDLGGLDVPLVAAGSHAELELSQADLPQPCAWVFGHEGQGVAPALMARATLVVRIPQPGGQESLNVAAAAAICLYESARRTAR